MHTNITLSDVISVVDETKDEHINYKELIVKIYKTKEICESGGDDYIYAKLPIYEPSYNDLDEILRNISLLIDLISSEHKDRFKKILDN